MSELKLERGGWGGGGGGGKQISLELLPLAVSVLKPENHLF